MRKDSSLFTRVNKGHRIVLQDQVHFSYFEKARGTMCHNHWPVSGACSVDRQAGLANPFTLEEKCKLEGGGGARWLCESAYQDWCLPKMLV